MTTQAIVTNEVSVIPNTTDIAEAKKAEALAKSEAKKAEALAKSEAKKAEALAKSEIKAEITAIKYAYESRLSLGSLFLTVAANPDKNGNFRTAYALEVNQDGLYDLRSYNLASDRVQSGKLIASFDFSAKQGLILDTVKIRPEELDRVLTAIYNSYRGDQVRTNCDYWLLYLLSVMSVADTATSEGITAYQELTPDRYIQALNAFPVTFEGLADRQELIKSKLLSLKIKIA